MEVERFPRDKNNCVSAYDPDVGRCNGSSGCSGVLAKHPIETPQQAYSKHGKISQSQATKPDFMSVHTAANSPSAVGSHKQESCDRTPHTPLRSSVACSAHLDGVQPPQHDGHGLGVAAVLLQVLLDDVCRNGTAALPGSWERSKGRGREIRGG